MGPLRKRVIGTLILGLAASGAGAGTAQRRMEGDEALLDAGSGGRLTLPPGTRVFRDVGYGADRRQRFDVYAPARATGAPVVFMVHGGGWRRGDKAMRSVVENKVRRWVTAGFVVVSANYRMIPDADPLEQARDVARGVAEAQRQATTWGGDRRRFILMGHSAGAHLVALLQSEPSVTAGLGVTPWLGVVVLDSGALDVPAIMTGRHARLFDDAFGSDPRFWRAASPFHALVRTGPPVLVVCSTRRGVSCPQARQFAARAVALGTRASVLPVDLSHRQINESLGEAGPYTAAVDAFLGTLEPGMRSLLQASPVGRAPTRHGRRPRRRSPAAGSGTDPASGS